MVHFGVRKINCNTTGRPLLNDRPNRCVIFSLVLEEKGFRQKLLAAARLRVKLPLGELALDYQDDVDTLYVRLKEKIQSTHSESDLDNMVIFDYEGEELIGVEIMDITGQLKDADPS